MLLEVMEKCLRVDRSFGPMTGTYYQLKRRRQPTPSIQGSAPRSPFECSLRRTQAQLAQQNIA